MGIRFKPVAHVSSSAVGAETPERAKGQLYIAFEKNDFTTLIRR